ncbi:multidrug effflux MFS transporter [Nocardioides litoris]|uniref:multidrug effflux MFS transporter n=1 Tax=Nocardioides litoris TaxID=1926648 RepID=UPI001B8847CA|nr:multidrug effflux MFS transporter [Nocardioides litoris]
MKGAGVDARAALALPVVLALLSMLGPFAIDTPFPAFDRMEADLGVGGDQMQLVVSAYLLAFGLMSPFHGPISDAVGRRPVMVAGVCVFALASVGCALAPSFELLLVCRVLQGLSAGGGVIVSRTVVRDLYDGDTAQRLMSRIMMIFGVAPALAPIVGGLLLQVGPWPLVFWFLGVLGLLLAVVVVVLLPETHPPERRLPFSARSLAGSMLAVGRHGRFHVVAWAAALSFAGQFLYIGAAPIFVVDLLGLGELDFWVFFVPMIIGLTTGAWISGRAAGRVRRGVLVTAAMSFALAGALVGVLLAALPATRAELPWAVLGPALIAVGTGAAYPSQQLLLLDMFPAARGAAVSMFTFFTLVLNAVVAGAVAPLVTGSVLSMAVTSAALVGAGLASWTAHLLTGRRARERAGAVPAPVPTESL